MDKEKILSEIKERLGDTTFSERTFGAYIDAHIPESEENPDFDKHVGFLKSLYGNYCHDIAEQAKAIKEKHESAGAEGQGDDKRYSALEEKFNKLMKSHTQLVERLEKQESQLSQEQLMTKVMAEMKKQGATDEYVLKQTLKGVTLDAKKSVADLATELLSDYDSEYTACRGKGAAPRNGEQGSGGKGKNSADGYFARKQKKEGWGSAQNK